MINIKAVQEYLDNQTAKAVEIYDFSNKKVKYSDKIMGWKIDKFNGNEEIVRAYLIAKLVNELGYKLENIELEKTYQIKGGHGKLEPRIDIIVKDEHDNPFLFIETKAPEKFEQDKKDIEGQLFELADREEKDYKTTVSNLVYYSLDESGDSISETMLLIDRSKIKEYSDWADKGFISHANTIPANYGQPQKELLKLENLKTLDKISLSKIRTNIHNTLWSAGIDDNEAYLFLVKYLLTKIYDEQNTRTGDPLICQIIDTDFKNESGLLDRINDRYYDALKNKLNYTDKDLDATGKILSQETIPIKSLYFLVQQLEKYSFSKSLKEQKEDILGSFFEETNREKFKQSKGQFFTHTNITKFIIYGLQLDLLANKLFTDEKRLPYIIDPSTGSGTFLIEVMKVITSLFKDIDQSTLTESEQTTYDNLFPVNRPNNWAEKYLYGIDNSYSLAISTKVNMILHGDGSSKIIKNDGIVNFQAYKNIKDNVLANYSKADDSIYGKSNGDFLVAENFDAIITNPPFSVNPIEDLNERSKHFLFGDKKNSENLFLERYYQLLKPQGRLGAVLPESIFDTTENKYIRLFIYKYFKVKAVVSLPQLTFEPFTSTKTSLLFAQKKSKKEVEEWNKLWSKFSKIYSELRTSINDYVKYFVNNEKLNEKWADYVIEEIENKRLDKIKQKILYFLKDYAEKEDKILEIKILLEKYSDEIIELSKTDNDLVGTLVSEYRENTWWVFGEVAKELNVKALFF